MWYKFRDMTDPSQLFYGAHEGGTDYDFVVRGLTRIFKEQGVVPPPNSFVRQLPVPIRPVGLRSAAESPGSRLVSACTFLEELEQTWIIKPTQDEDAEDAGSHRRDEAENEGAHNVPGHFKERKAQERPIERAGRERD